MSTTLWTRSWRYKTKRRKGKAQAKRVHVEVRDPEQTLVYVKSYRGKDHTFHIILEEQPEPPKKKAKKKAQDRQFDPAPVKINEGVTLL